VCGGDGTTAGHLCRACSGTGRGPRVAGQNFPPRIPDGYRWDFNDGDFGLYRVDEDGRCCHDDAVDYWSLSDADTVRWALEQRLEPHGRYVARPMTSMTRFVKAGAVARACGSSASGRATASAACSRS
jgi:hypothetical protein